MDLRYQLNDYVKIIPLERLKGRVEGVYIGGKWVRYDVRYFSDGRAYNCYFQEDELEPVDASASAGYTLTDYRSTAGHKWEEPKI